MIVRRRRQRGFATLMSVLVLLVVVGLSLTVALQMGASSVADSAAQSDHIEALFLAESGLERAVRRLSAGACDGATLVEATPTAFGRGDFQVLAAAINAGLCTVQVAGRVNGAVRTIEADIVGGGGAIEFHVASSGTASNSTSVSWNHARDAAGTDRLLIVGVSFRRSYASQVVTGVTYRGVSLLPIGATQQGETRVELWYLVNTPNQVAGNTQLQVTLSGNNSNRTVIVAGAVSLRGVNQTAPIIDSAFNEDTTGFFGGTASVPIATGVDNAWVVAALAKETNGAVNIGGGGQVEQWDAQAGGGGGIHGAGSTNGPVSPAASVTMSWNWFALFQSADWAIGAAAIRPAGAAQVVRWREVVN